ncbi:MAG: phosphoadenylyl-sulfate reductase [Pseudomonadales bacterium]|nr:phosphoadenylyl-sulfate reductase [Pseudomonadales bacterium]
MDYTANSPSSDQREPFEHALRRKDAKQLDTAFASLSAPERVEQAIDRLPASHALTSSFGAQAAVSLHMLTQVLPNLPVILLDTGYLFPETYEFIQRLRDRLDMNLHIYSAKMSAAMQEAIYGQRWEQGIAGLDAYNQDNKVEPLQRAFSELEVGTWFSGLRRSQATSRRETPFVDFTDGRYKVAPIADWSDKDVFDYLNKHKLPYHPLWHKGYVSIGDTHTTRALHEVDSLEETRFFGLKRECGIHA